MRPTETVHTRVSAVWEVMQAATPTPTTTPHTPPTLSVVMTPISFTTTTTIITIRCPTPVMCTSLTMLLMRGQQAKGIPMLSGRGSISMKRHGGFKIPLIGQAMAMRRGLLSILLTQALPKYERVERESSLVKVPCTSPPFPHSSGDPPAQTPVGGSCQCGEQSCNWWRIVVALVNNS